MLRFRGLAKSSGGRSGGILSSITGYQVVRDGDDWVVPDDDPQLKKGPPPVLAAADKPTTLSKAKYDDIAATFVNHNLNLNKEFEEFRKSHPITPNPVPLEYGVLSDFWRIRDAFFFWTRNAYMQLYVMTFCPSCTVHCAQNRCGLYM